MLYDIKINKNIRFKSFKRKKNYFVLLIINLMNRNREGISSEEERHTS